MGKEGLGNVVPERFIRLSDQLLQSSSAEGDCQLKNDQCTHTGLSQVQVHFNLELPDQSKYCAQPRGVGLSLGNEAGKELDERLGPLFIVFLLLVSYALKMVPSTAMSSFSAEMQGPPFQPFHLS